MPIYEYECVPQGHRFEELQKISDEPLTSCKICGGEVRKLVSMAGFQFKGGGWYKDGYSKSGANGSTTPKESTASTEAPKKSDAPPPTTTTAKENKS